MLYEHRVTPLPFAIPAIGLLLGVALFLSACSAKPVENSALEKLNIVCTTGMIGDAALRIAADKANVITLMGPGVDPHLYKATQGDLQILSNADVILYNGLHLEGKMGEIFQKLAKIKKVKALAEAIPQERLLQPEGSTGAFDPHVWFDVSLWAEVVQELGRALSRADPVNEAFYLQNTENYLAELAELHRWVKEQIHSVPPERRVLITAHDAFGYFGRAYDIEVHGLQGISTASEYGLRDISNLVNFLTERKIKAVFVESSVPAKSLEAVVEGCTRRGHAIVIGGNLFSDAMGAEGSPEGTYAGMVRANVNIIVSGIR